MVNYKIDHTQEAMIFENREFTLSHIITQVYIYIYRVTHFNLGSQITRKLSPANKNVSDKSCMVSRGP